MAIGGDRSQASGGGPTHLHDLPEPLLAQVFRMVSDVRTRNAMSLACRRWRSLERATRSALALRGTARNPFLLPACFPSVAHLDLSLLSPWGHHALLLHPHRHFSAGGGGGGGNNHQPAASDHSYLVAARLGLVFPAVTSLVVYARNPSVLATLAPQWPGLRAAKLVRWHPRPGDQPLGADLGPLLAACPALDSLDLSEFYCWNEDIPAALAAHPAAAASLARLDLLCAPSAEGFRALELAAIAAACPNLRQLLAPCVFNPRCFEFVGDDALLALARGCPRLSRLHLADPSTLSSAGNNPSSGGATREDAAVTGPGLEALFAALPGLKDLALDLCHNVRDAGPALEALSSKCPKIKSLKLGQFQGVCKAAWLHLDGVAVCGGLESLCVKNCADLTDSGLAAIGRGCRRLSKLEIHGCSEVTEMGVRKLAAMLRPTLADVRISGCKHLDAARSLRALEPIRDRINRLHIDCIWARPGAEQPPPAVDEAAGVDEFEQEEILDEAKNKKCRHSDSGSGSDDYTSNSSDGFWYRSWERLRYLSLWVPAGEVLTPLADAGLDDCPELEEVCIKVEGDCRTCPRPSLRVFGLSSLARYPQLAKMKLDCGEAIGYALTAPSGHMDLSLWERFYLQGIGDLNLYELDYWPPQDKEVNQRCLSLPATGLIQGCLALRKLFIHGTTHEHFMRFFLEMPRLRDVQLREDYYPAPEDDMSTEMRVDSCSRFEEALNSRTIPD